MERQRLQPRVGCLGQRRARCRERRRSRPRRRHALLRVVRRDGHDLDPGRRPDGADEDVVYYNAGAWSLYFDGSVNGVGGTDLDAISIVAGTLYFSTDDTIVPPGAGGTGDDADIYRWNGGELVHAGWSMRRRSAGRPTTSTASCGSTPTHMYLSYGTDTTVPVIGAVQDEDVVYNDAGTWSVYFDGTAHGLTVRRPGRGCLRCPVDPLATTRKGMT